MSWQVLAVNHMCVHRHLNLVVFAVPFLPLAFVAAGFAAKFIGRRAGGGLLALVPVLMAANVAYSVNRAADRKAEQDVADELVAQHLAGPQPAGVGALDRVGPAAGVAPALLVEWGLFDANTGGPTNPDAVVIAGWALGKPAAQVVAVCGGRVVPSRVQWFRRPDLDALAGEPLHRAGFVMVVPSVPSAGLTPGERVRVFAVTGGVGELAAP